MKKILLFLALSITLLLSGCGEGPSAELNSLKGDIIGNRYNIDGFDDYGTITLQAHGDKINLESNVVKEREYDGDSWYTTKTLSSVVTVNIDGQELVSCGDTLVFYENSLQPELWFDNNIEINSSSENGILDATSITGVLNKYKNYFGCSKIVLIKSQSGTPLYAFSGDSVNWSVAPDLPKTTRLSIDGRLVYIHRANFQIIDRALLN